MGEPRELALLSKAQQMLAEAKTLDEVKTIHDKAKAIELYLREQKMAGEMQNDAAELALRAAERGGEILREMEKNKGKLKVGPVVPTDDHGESRKLAEIGLTKNQSSKWQ